MTAVAASPLTGHEVATALADARWLCVNYGWIQHRVGSVKEGFSADGAILAAADTHTGLHFAARRVFQRIIGGYEIGPWNDQRGMTRDRVLAAFLNAEHLARTGGAS